MQKQKAIWHPFETTAALEKAAADAIIQCAEESIAQRGRFLIVLAGGRTPSNVYQMLRESQTDWSKWHVYHGDERCLPPDDDNRNSLVASRSLLDHVPIPRGQVHPIPAELGAIEGAEAYNVIMADVGTFDLVLLGLGEDGHTASLFPGHTWDHNPPVPAIPVKHAPKPPSDRISLSASRLSDARNVLFMVTGEGKRHAVQNWRGAAYLPAKAITPEDGVDVLVDAAAYGD